MSLKIKSKKLKEERGITLFIAVVIMGILVFISFAVVNIAAKSALFASSGRDSKFAFYAADAGLECALFWDATPDASKFSTSTTGGSITCGGTSASPNVISVGDDIAGTSTTITQIGGGGDSSPVSVFGFDLNDGSHPVPYCVIVTVHKYYEDSRLWTYIKSRGYNTCDANNPRRIERGIEVYY